MAAQVRNLVSGSGAVGPAARTMPIPRVSSEVLDDVDDAAGADEVPSTTAWLPGADFERQLPAPEPPPARHSRAISLRWNPGRRGAAALGLLVIVLVAAAGWWLASAKPKELPVATAGAGPNVSAPASAGPSSGSPAGQPSGAFTPSSASNAVTSSGASLVIDVAGKVRHPGIYLMPPGSRVYEALRAAGGVRPGVSTVSLNLAEPLRDGEQIVVGVPGAGASPPTASTPVGGSGSGSAVGTVVDLNTASLEQLDSLPGVGPATAQKILDYRAAHGAFTSIDQLQNVSGIGPAKFAAMKSLVRV